MTCVTYHALCILRRGKQLGRSPQVVFELHHLIIKFLVVTSLPFSGDSGRFCNRVSVLPDGLVRFHSFQHHRFSVI